MQFFKKREFYDYIHNSFNLSRGVTSLIKAEEVGVESDIYLFFHGDQYNRNRKGFMDVGARGTYILHGCYEGPIPKDQMIKTIEKWYGQKVERVIGWNEKYDSYSREVLVKVPDPKEGFWRFEDMVTNDG